LCFKVLNLRRVVYSQEEVASAGSILVDVADEDAVESHQVAAEGIGSSSVLESIVHVHDLVHAVGAVEQEQFVGAPLLLHFTNLQVVFAHEVVETEHQGGRHREFILLVGSEQSGWCSARVLGAVVGDSV